MKIPRLPIAWLMIGIAAIAFPFAVVGSVIRNRPLFGLESCLDMGLLPTVPILVAYFLAVVRRCGTMCYLDIGFLVSGWVAVCAYVYLSWMVPERVAAPIVYYINEIEPQFMNCDLEECYILSLVIRSLILAAPQLLIAWVGGVVAERFFGRGNKGRFNRPDRRCDR